MSNSFSSFVAGVPEAVRRALLELKRLISANADAITGKVAKAGDTMTGSLTIDHDGTALVLKNSAGSSEGGEIRLDGAGSYLPFTIDNNVGDLRFFREGSVRMRIGGDGDGGIYGPSNYPITTVQRALYTPGLGVGGIVVGTGGVNEATYTYVGGSQSGEYGIMYLNGRVTLGSSGWSVGNPSVVGLPSGFSIPSNYYTSIVPLGQVTFYDSSTGSNYSGALWYNDTGSMRFVCQRADATYVTWQGTLNQPFTWASGDGFRWTAAMAVQRS